MVRVDQGGELWKSLVFCSLVQQHGYIIDPTGSDAVSENAAAERPHDTLGGMVCSLLYLAGLPPKFWADALLHAVYLRNRMVHRTIGMTPIEKWTGHKPDVTHLRVFGSQVVAKSS